MGALSVLSMYILKMLTPCLSLNFAKIEHWMALQSVLVSNVANPLISIAA